MKSINDILNQAYRLMDALDAMPDAPKYNARFWRVSRAADRYNAQIRAAYGDDVSRNRPCSRRIYAPELRSRRDEDMPTSTDLDLDFDLQCWCKSEFADSEYEDISVMMGWA